MNSPSRRQTALYVALAVVCFAVALLAGLTPLAAQFDNYHYDWLFRLHKTYGAPNSILLAIDEQTLLTTGGRRHLRPSLALALERIAAVQPKAMAIDLILSDAGDPQEDAQLATALQKVPNLLLSADLIPNAGTWEEPLPQFRKAAVAVGHVHADPDKYDGVCRQLLLAKVAGHDRRWALALESYKLWLGGKDILESPRDLEIAGRLIPAPQTSRGRPFLIRYRYDPIPQVSLLDLMRDVTLTEKFRGKAVFVGVTAQTETRDRLFTPYSDGVITPGVEIHAHAFETMAQQQYLRNAPDSALVGLCLLLAAIIATIFYLRAGWPAYTLGGTVLFSAHVIPQFAFLNGIVLPVVAPVTCAWLSAISCGAFQYFVVRRALLRSEADRQRYEQAIHFVIHELRTPLTAIQGSSELMSRYPNLSEEKRKQMAQTINSESKRLGHMIKTFLDVERLSAGQMEIKQEPFSMDVLVAACVERVRPLAERKRIRLHVDSLEPESVHGDRELMEYAIYNLLTNAVKYSPSDTEVTVDERSGGGNLRVAVRDQGIGMDEKELRSIFRKFYRTKRAEASGEVGTGIGLSIVQQIVHHHGGRIEVSSAPNQGSCFTVVLPNGRPSEVKK
jgi:signal transduction histidine kinase